MPTAGQAFTEGSSSVLELGASEAMQRPEDRTIQEALGDDFLCVGKDIASAFGGAASVENATIFRDLIATCIQALNTREDSSRVFAQEVFEAADAKSKHDLLEALNSRELHQLKQILTADSPDRTSRAADEEKQLTFSVN